MEDLINANNQIKAACEALDQKSRVVAIHGRTGSGKTRFAASVAKDFMDLHKAEVLFADVYKGGSEYKQFASGEVKSFSNDKLLASKQALEAIMSDINEKAHRRESKKTLYILEDSQVFQQDEESKDLLMRIIANLKQANSSLLLVAQRRKFIPEIEDCLVIKREAMFIGL